MAVNRERKISSFLNKKRPFSRLELSYFIPLKKTKVKKKIQDIKGDRLLFLEGEGLSLSKDNLCRKSSLPPF